MKSRCSVTLGVGYSLKAEGAKLQVVRQEYQRKALTLFYRAQTLDKNDHLAKFHVALQLAILRQVWISDILRSNTNIIMINKKFRIFFINGRERNKYHHQLFACQISRFVLYKKTKYFIDKSGKTYKTDLYITQLPGILLITIQMEVKFISYQGVSKVVD